MPVFVTITLPGFRSRWTTPCAVRAVQRGGDLDPIAQRLIERQGPARESLRERLAVDQLHDEETRSVVFANVVQRADAGVLERGDRAGFLLEAPDALDVGRDRRRQDLDRDLTGKPRVLRPVDLAHTARANQARRFRMGRDDSRRATDMVVDGASVGVSIALVLSTWPATAPLDPARRARINARHNVDGSPAR